LGVKIVEEFKRVFNVGQDEEKPGVIRGGDDITGSDPGVDGEPGGNEAADVGELAWGKSHDVGFVHGNRYNTGRREKKRTDTTVN